MAISQLLIYWAYIMPLVSGRGIVLDGSLWWLFIVDTIIIAASGYVINDIFDQSADIINKPNSIYVGDLGMSRRTSWIYYIALVFVGFLIALYISYSIDKLHLLLIYPIAIGLLYLYSNSFKKLPLIGNIVVAVFCAFVPGILLYAEWEVLTLARGHSQEDFDGFMIVYVSYIVFAFLVTMVREIVKDIEDTEGDKAARYKTLPIVLGLDFSRLVSIGFGILLLLSYGLWVTPFIANGIHSFFAFFSVIMFCATFYILFKISQAKEKYDYSKISTLLKYLMVASLLIFLLNPYVTLYV